MERGRKAAGINRTLEQHFVSILKCSVFLLKKVCKQYENKSRGGWVGKREAATFQVSTVMLGVSWDAQVGVVAVGKQKSNARFTSE